LFATRPVFVPERLLVPRRLPEHLVQEIVRRADVARIVGRYCELTRKGSRYWACCPFHKEKTPSFSLDADSGLFYCFGCKEGGNIFQFLQKVDGLTFAEALGKLADEVGMDLSAYAGRSSSDRGELGRLRELNELATSFYQKCLEKSAGAARARDYLCERHISPESTATWRLGYAPDGWEHFLKCATGRGYDAPVVEKGGLAVPRKGAPGCYDRFRNRLMFPIADPAGRTIGFGARTLQDDEQPKYLNTPETPLFSKGRCFFGLSQAKEAIRSGGTAVVLEGYTDVIMAHQAGIREAIAVLGTALSPEHAGRIGRLCKRAVLVFDADEAGRRSTSRSIEILLNEDIEIRVAQLPPGQDPCEFIVENGGDAFRKRIEASTGFFEFRLDLARMTHDTGTIEGRAAAFDELADLALAVPDEARRDMIVRWIAGELGIRERKAWAALDGRRSPLRADHGEQGPVTEAAGLSAESGLPAELLGMLLVHPDWMPRAFATLDVALLRDGPEKVLLERLLGQANTKREFDVGAFLNALTDPELAAAAARAQAEERGRKQDVDEKLLEKRLDSYAGFLARKTREVPSAAAPRSGASNTTEPGRDPEERRAELAAYYKRRLEEDRRYRSKRELG